MNRHPLWVELGNLTLEFDEVRAKVAEESQMWIPEEVLESPSSYSRCLGISFVDLVFWAWPICHRQSAAGQPSPIYWCISCAIQFSAYLASEWPTS